MKKCAICEKSKTLTLLSCEVKMSNIVTKELKTEDEFVCESCINDFNSKKFGFIGMDDATREMFKIVSIKLV